MIFCITLILELNMKHLVVHIGRPTCNVLLGNYQDTHPNNLFIYLLLLSKTKYVLNMIISTREGWWILPKSTKTDKKKLDRTPPLYLGDLYNAS